MAGEGRQGSGVTITFATSNFTAKIRSVSESYQREAIDASHAGSEWMEKLLSDLVEFRSVELDILYDPDQTPPIDPDLVPAAGETITLTYKPTAAQATGADIEFLGGCTAFETTGPYKELMTARMTITPTGAPTRTAGAA